MTRHRGDRLARARLADDAEHLASAQVVGDAAHGVDDAVLGGEVDREVLDVEHTAPVRPLPAYLARVSLASARHVAAAPGSVWGRRRRAGRRR